MTPAAVDDGARPGSAGAPAGISHWIAAALALCIAAAAPARAQSVDDGDKAGVFDDRIVFGQSAALSGPAGSLGIDMRLGLLAAFAEANGRGGVHGRRLELVSLDDSYEPETAVANTRQLATEENVFALIGAVGTPTARAAVPVAAEAGAPYIAPFTGAEFLRDPELRHVVNLRASYFQETEAIVDSLVGAGGVDRIAILYQDDSFGRAGYEGVLRALDRRDMAPVAIGVYPRNTTVVKTALLDLVSRDPGAVVAIGAYRPIAAFIAWARRIGFEPVFSTISFVGSGALVEELGADGVGVYVSQVVPAPTGGKSAVAAAYRAALAAHAPDAAPGFVSFEGYLAGRLAILGLERCDPPGRACFIDAFRGMETVDIDGFPLSFGENDNQGSDAVYLTAIGADGRFHAVESFAEEARPR